MAEAISLINQGGNNYLETTLRSVQTNDYNIAIPRFKYREDGTPCSLMASFTTNLHRDGTETAAKGNWGHGGGCGVAYAMDAIDGQGGFIAKGGGQFTAGESRDALANNPTINHSIVMMTKYPSGVIQDSIKTEFNRIAGGAGAAFDNTQYWNLPTWSLVWDNYWGGLDCKILGLSARGYDGQPDVAASWTGGVVGSDADGVMKQTGEFPQYYLSLPDLPQLQNYTASKTGFNSKNAFLAPIDLSSVNNTSVGDETYTSERKTELYNDLGNSMPITINTLRVRICDINGVPTEDLDAYTIACLEVRPDPVIKQAKMMAKYIRQSDMLTDRQILPYGRQVQ